MKHTKLTFSEAYTIKAKYQNEDGFWTHIEKTQLVEVKIGKEKCNHYKAAKLFLKENKHLKNITIKKRKLRIKMFNHNKVSGFEQAARKQMDNKEAADHYFDIKLEIIKKLKSVNTTLEEYLKTFFINVEDNTEISLDKAVRRLTLSELLEIEKDLNVKLIENPNKNIQLESILNKISGNNVLILINDNALFPYTSQKLKFEKDYSDDIDTVYNIKLGEEIALTINLKSFDEIGDFTVSVKNNKIRRVYFRNFDILIDN